jgi:hypothetical protein
MSDEAHKHSSETIIGWFENLAMSISGFLADEDQEELTNKPVPSNVAKIAFNAAHQRYLETILWFQKYWGIAKTLSIMWLVTSLVLIGYGTWRRADESMMSMSLIGFYMLALHLYVISACAKPFYYLCHMLKRATLSLASVVAEGANQRISTLGVRIPIPSLSPKDDIVLEASALNFQRFFITLVCIALAIGGFFSFSGGALTEWNVLALLRLAMPLAFLAAVGAKFGWDNRRGWKLMVIGYLLLTAYMLVPVSIREIGGQVKERALEKARDAVVAPTNSPTKPWNGKLEDDSAEIYHYQPRPAPRQQGPVRAIKRRTTESQNENAAAPKKFRGFGQALLDLDDDE